MKIEKTITLIRHGQTEYNEKDLMQGQIDLPLSKRGVEEAELLREELAGEKFDIIYHSPLLRAFQTAEIVNKEHNLKYIALDCFKEIKIGEWEGKEFKNLHIHEREFFSKWIADARTRIPGGESYFDVQERVKEGVTKILASDYRKILIFGHIAVNRGILGNLFDIDPNLTRRFKFNNCAYSTLQIYANRFQTNKDNAKSFVLIENWNITKHLESLTR